VISEVYLSFEIPVIFKLIGSNGFCSPTSFSYFRVVTFIVCPVGVVIKTICAGPQQNVVRTAIWLICRNMVVSHAEVQRPIVRQLQLRKQLINKQMIIDHMLSSP